MAPAPAGRLAGVRLRRAALLICGPIAAMTVVALAMARDDRFCTLMATYDGVVVSVVPWKEEQPRIDALLAAVHREHPRWRLGRSMREATRRARAASPLRHATVCVDRRCVTRRPPFGFGITLPGGEGAYRREVRVFLHYKDGRRPALRARVMMQPNEINGPGCGTYWQAALHVEDGRLVVDRG
jgi:hypothetical protein